MRRQGQFGSSLPRARQKLLAKSNCHDHGQAPFSPARERGSNRTAKVGAAHTNDIRPEKEDVLLFRVFRESRTGVGGAIAVHRCTIGLGSDGILNFDGGRGRSRLSGLGSLSPGLTRRHWGRIDG